MDASTSTPVKVTEVDGTDIPPPKEELETPSTMREKKTATRKHVMNNLRSLRKIVKKALKGQTFVTSLLDEGIDVEPLQFGQRVVLRNQVPLSVRRFMDMHAIYKQDSTDATNMLRAARHPHLGLYPLNRVALRAEFEEKQKITAQMARLFSSDLDDDRRTQQLCEQVSEVHGIPSDVELEVLGEVGNVDDEVIEAWFRTKRSRLKANKAIVLCRRHSVASARKTKLKSLPQGSDVGSRPLGTSTVPKQELRNPDE